MKTLRTFIAMGLAMASAGGSVSSPSAPASADFSAGYPNQQASQALYDEMDYQRAVQAYLWATPLVNSVAFRKALVEVVISK